MSGSISRRSVLQSMAALAASAAALPAFAESGAPARFANSINPRWYGFNLMEYFSTDPDWMKYFPYKNDGMFPEDDFKWMRDWGFNFVRLPMDYRFWTDPNDLMKINEKMVEPIDRAIKLGEKYGVHVNIGLHRAPGECILDDMDEKATGIHITPETLDVYRSQTAMDAFVHQWVYFAGRYAGLSNQTVSFNLVNEPVDRSHQKDTDEGRRQYVRVAQAAIRGIRSKDPKRLIVTDGYPCAGLPIPELYDAEVVQSCHDYVPAEVTCYQTEWVRPGNNLFSRPTWPLHDRQGKLVADRHTIENQFHAWTEPAKHGVPIHFSETGCNRYTSPKVAHAWYSDTLEMIGSLRSGWALWNFRGSNGILDTNRDGTECKDWYGHKLDHTLLKILQSKMKS